jgi:hypothetical protein
MGCSCDLGVNKFCGTGSKCYDKNGIEIFGTQVKIKELVINAEQR